MAVKTFMINKRTLAFRGVIICLALFYGCSKVWYYKTLDDKYNLQIKNANVALTISGHLTYTDAKFFFVIENRRNSTVNIDMKKFDATISFFAERIRPSYIADLPDSAQPLNSRPPETIEVGVGQKLELILGFKREVLPIPYEKNIWREFMKTHIVEIHPNQPNLITDERWQFQMKGGEEDWF